jgi:uncharacterized membrane protein
MSTVYLCVKWLHIVSSTVLFGTGGGIAFFFVRAHRTRDVNVIAAIAGDVVLADMVFTTTAVVLQPTTGLTLALAAGYPLTTPWLLAALLLYILVGCFWLPVVWLQIRMRDIARLAAGSGVDLPPVYQRYYRWWFGLGWPAFLGVLIIFYLMVAKPTLIGSSASPPPGTAAPQPRERRPASVRRRGSSPREAAFGAGSSITLRRFG